MWGEQGASELRGKKWANVTGKPLEQLGYRRMREENVTRTLGKTDRLKIYNWDQSVTRYKLTGKTLKVDIALELTGGGREGGWHKID
jgi:hypothetical protein